MRRSARREFEFFGRQRRAIEAAVGAQRAAYTMVVTDVFYLSSALFFALIAVVWRARPKPGGAAAAGGAH